MSHREFFIARHEAEYSAFKRVIEAMPQERFDYRPHERSPSAGDIVWTLALETKACCAFIDTGRVDWAHVDPPAEPSAIIEAFHQSYRELDERLQKLDDDGWSKTCQLSAGGNLMREAPLGELLWYLFFDAIHHRGQLSTYIRPMGGRVPAIYGPSGDEPAQ